MSRRRRAAERRILQLLQDQKARIFTDELLAHILRHHLHFSPSLLLFFNSLLKSHSLSPSSSHLSLPLFSLLRHLSLFPNHLTFPPLLKSLSNLRHLIAGQSIHATTIISGFHSYPSISIATLDLYSSCHHLHDARNVFDEMPHRDAVVWNILINAFSKAGDLQNAYLFFRRADHRNTVTWNSIINGFAKAGKDEAAMDLFKEMWDAGIELDDATLATVLPVCARLGAVHAGRLIHDHARRRGLLKDAVNNVHVLNSLIDMYCKCGDLVTARKVFDEMPKRSVVSWNAMINGLGSNGRGEDGLELFESMMRSGFRPNAGTFLGVLGCCRHTGMVGKGREVFRVMAAEYGVEPEIEHYGCMVDLLGRCGFVREGYELITRMTMRPSAAIWGALLSSCRNYGDVEMAVVAAKELVEVEPWNSGNYVLLSNVYAEAGRWEDVEKVRISMKEQCVKKAAPGQSLIGLSSSVGL
ncbi:LOW QUALITY PROTEIN: pentatricopeptide repeat-containing protein At1g09190 [Dioscorea cayenensis subsp. rotundata]|uniref:LOW QUALITY PROTEIN: pentatricopeptide repeat-containing protein At1g09190 n=1 Tax=Dioscorea cayennensis subsp. rotundata TaxID=55577 RepID=A0AB40BLN3_DIOCR|nr:LOW QUALITY PROTEIN: pentatricopeptide repeat-containing protein At1g09190 [Dioscorea cayenensis subsp. rotundata]